MNNNVTFAIEDSEYRRMESLAEEGLRYSHPTWTHCLR